MKAAGNAGRAAETLEHVKKLVADEGPGGFVSRILSKELQYVGPARPLALLGHNVRLPNRSRMQRSGQAQNVEGLCTKGPSASTAPSSP